MSHVPSAPPSRRSSTSLVVLATGLVTLAGALWAAPPAAAATTPKLTLTYSSPAQPWTTSQLSTLKSWASAALPLLTTVYGPPMHSITVNVTQGASGSFAGEYDPVSNTAQLSTFAEDVFIHELVHAYHDDDIISDRVWEEGLARAVEVQVATQVMPGYWDASHSDPYDVYYDNINKPKLGVAGGDIIGNGDVSLDLLRYQAASYAFTKIMVQNPQFLPRLNAALYATPSLAGDTAGLVSRSTALQPKVEGVAFSTWYKAQGIFNAAVTPGCFLSQRISQYTVDAFCRDSSGRETPMVTPVSWSVADYTGAVVSSGSCTTVVSYGWCDLTPHFPVGYSGRIKVTVKAALNGKAVTDATWRTVGPETGVFGVSTVAASGTVTFASLDGLFTTFSTPVTHGAFSAPSLQTVRGRIRATFTGTNGTVTRYFDKDAAAYSLVLKTV